MNAIRLRRPEEGWLALILVSIMALLLAWAIDEPAWVNGHGRLTDGLSTIALLGVAVGFAGPKLGWGRWTTHLVGAVFAGLLLPIFGGWASLPGTSVGQAFQLAAAGSVDAYLDIAWRNLRFTDQEVHYILVLGALVWGTAQFASYAVFGHRRPFNGIVVMGLVLIANIALTSRPQLPYLVAYTAAALFLLIEMHAFDERATWLRRRIGDPATISSLYLRGGTVFIALALLGSMVLTTRAASSPLAGAWDGVDEQLIAIGEQLGRYLPNGGDLRPVGGVTFGSTFKIRDTWTTDPGIAFTATVPATEEKLYWRAATYDQFLLEGWDQTQTSKQAVDAGQSLLANTPEAAVESQTRPVTVTVRPDEYRDRAMLVPGIPVTADRSVQVILTGTRGWFGGIELSSARDGYTVQARVLQMGKGQDQITENRLRNAGTVYPAEITALYTGVPDGAIGPDATELLQAIISEAGTTEPYTLAKAMETYLRDPTHFFYTPDVSGIDCPSDSVVECFARFQRGYCLHYASTMAILLRAANPDHPIPTRLVQGFLPGQRSGNTETVENRSAHAWVEVFFPGYGWIRFDPTGGGIGTPTEIVEGPSIAPASPSPSGSGGPDLPDPTRRNNGDTGDPATATPPSSRGPGDRTLLILLSVLLALVVGAVAFAAWLRGPRGEVSPDVAWGSMSKAASRFGFGPRPTQTVYEYATTLGDLVPVARADLQTVAEAKVETTYAGVRIGGARLDSVRTATRRLRITLLRLLLRRPRRGSRR